MVTVTFAPASSSAAIVLPATLDFGDAVLSPLAHITDGKLYFNEIGDSDPVDQWAQWAVTADHTGTYLFTMGVSSDNEQSYRITILDNSLNEVDVFDSNPGSGEKTLKHYFYLVAGDYFVKVENTYAWSHGHVVSLVVTEPAISALDEAATTNDTILALKEGGGTHDIQIMRTFAGGMYNTICLPFAVTSSKVREIFGAGVVWKYLSGAELDETESILELSFTDAPDIYPGTPYIIKPLKNVVNPVFDGVEVTATSGSATTSCTKANFKGTFVSSSIPAGEDNLFLGQNNLLYFNKSAATPIGGFRGWFVLKDLGDGPHFIKGARIVERENTATGIENVNQQPTANSQKLIENGMLIITRDGVRYNVMGVRVE